MYIGCSNMQVTARVWCANADASDSGDGGSSVPAQGDASGTTPPPKVTQQSLSASLPAEAQKTSFCDAWAMAAWGPEYYRRDEWEDCVDDMDVTVVMSVWDGAQWGKEGCEELGSCKVPLSLMTLPNLLVRLQHYMRRVHADIVLSYVPGEGGNKWSFGEEGVLLFGTPGPHVAQASSGAPSDPTHKDLLSDASLCEFLLDSLKDLQEAMKEAGHKGKTRMTLNIAAWRMYNRRFALKQGAAGEDEIVFDNGCPPSKTSLSHAKAIKLLVPGFCSRDVEKAPTDGYEAVPDPGQLQMVSGVVLIVDPDMESNDAATAAGVAKGTKCSRISTHLLVVHVFEHAFASPTPVSASASADKPGSCSTCKHVYQHVISSMNMQLYM